MPFPGQEPTQAPIAKAPPLRRQLTQSLAYCRIVWPLRLIVQARAGQSHPPAGAPPALAVFSEQILERRVIQYRFGQQLLQPSVLILQRLQPARLRYLQPAVLRFPLVKSRIRDPVPPTYLWCLGLPPPLAKSPL